MATSDLNENQVPKSDASQEGLNTTQVGAEVPKVDEYTQLPVDENGAEVVDGLSAIQTITNLTLAEQDANQAKAKADAEAKAESLEQVPEEEDVLPVVEEPVEESPEDKVTRNYSDIAATIAQAEQNKIDQAAGITDSPEEVINKYAEKSNSKAEILSLIETNPELASQYLGSGVITSADLNNKRIQQTQNESLRHLAALKSAWITDTDSFVGAAANTILQGVAGLGSAVLSVPDAGITLAETLTQEPITDTDRQHQTYLIGRENLIKADSDRNNDSLPAEERAKAQSDYDALRPAVEAIQADLKTKPDYARTYEKYATSYYQDASQNFIGSMRESISAITNNSNTETLYNDLSTAIDGDVDVLYNAKAQLDEGNLLQATGTFFAGIAGMSSSAVSAIASNPMGVVDTLSASLGMMAGGGLLGKGAKLSVGAISSSMKAQNVAEKFGHMFMYQNMFAADAYATFEQNYGHLPEGDQLAILNGVAATAAFLATAGDKFMAGNLARLSTTPNRIKATSFKDALDGVPKGVSATNAIGKLARGTTKAVTSHTASGAAFETGQEFIEGLLTQYAGTQDFDKIDVKDATVQALMATGAGGLVGAVGDIGSGVRSAISNQGKGKLEIGLRDSRENFSLGRSDLSNEAKATSTVAQTTQSLSDVDASLDRNEEGEVISNTANTLKVSDLYDTVLQDLGGLDSVLAINPAMDGSSVRVSIEEGIREGTPLTEIISDTVSFLESVSSPEAITKSLLARPEARDAYIDALQVMSPESVGKLRGDLTQLATNVSAVIKQVTDNATALAGTYDLEAMAKEADAGSKAEVAKYKADKRAAKKAKKAEAKDTSLSPEETAAEVAKTKSESAYYNSVADYMKAATGAEVTAKASEETSVTGETATDYEAADVDVEAVVKAERNFKDDEDTVLNSPSMAVDPVQGVYSSTTGKDKIPLSQAGDLGSLNTSMKSLYRKLRENPKDKGTTDSYIGSTVSLLKDLQSFVSRPNPLTDLEKAQARTMLLGALSYTFAFAQLKDTNNLAIGALLNPKKSVHFGNLKKQLKAQGVDISQTPDLLQTFKRLANTSADGSVVTERATPSDTSIDRPSPSVTSTVRTGVHTTADLVNLGVPEAFSTLNGLVANILNDNVKNVPEDFLEDVVHILSGDTIGFDSLYTRATVTNANLLATASSTFKNNDVLAQSESAAAESYKSLAEYFTRIDPEHRDLTFVISKYMPEVHSALNTMLEGKQYPSEFNSELNKVVKAKVFQAVEDNIDNLPSGATEQTGMMVDGLNSIKESSTENHQEFVELLVQEGLEPTGRTIEAIKEYLRDTEDSVSMPTAIVNKTMLQRVNAFVNSKQLPNVVSEVETEVETLWADNVYNGTAEALTRLALGSNALANFTANTAKTGAMYQVYNVFSVLEDPTHENHAKVVNSFNATELAELEAITPMVQKLRNINAHSFNSIQALASQRHNSKALDLFESLSDKYGATGESYMHPNLSAIIAQTAFEYAMSDGISALGFNDQRSLESLVGKTLANNPTVKEELATGSTVAALAPRLGKTIRKRLGIDGIANQATRDEVGQLENSLGHMALLMLDNAGIIQAKTVYVTRTGNRYAAKTNAKEGFGFIPKAPTGSEISPEHIYHVYTFNEETLKGYDKEDGTTMFSQFSLSKTTAQKLYGKEAKEDIATDPSDIVVVGQGSSKLKAEARAMSENSPQYLHSGKATVFANFGAKLQEAIFGGQVNVEATHESRRKNAEAKNRKAKSDIARVFQTFKELDAAETSKFYLHQIVGGNTRFTGTNPKGIDPVGMSAARFLVNVAEQDIITLGSTDAVDKAKETMFHKAMITALDIGKPYKAEEMTAEQAKAAFEGIANIAGMQEAVALVNQSKVEALTDAESARLNELLENGVIGSESMAHTLDAVFVYSNYLEAYKEEGSYSFDATMFVEIDGKNNGSALGITQNAPIKNIEDFKRMANSVGIDFDHPEGIAFSDLKQGNPEFLDAYQHLTKAAGQVGEDFVEGKISEAEMEELMGGELPDDYDHAKAIGQFPVIMQMLTGSLGTGKAATLLDSDGNVTSQGRQLFKDVLMTVLYGASISTQDRYFANTILSKHISAMEQFAEESRQPLSQEEAGALRVRIQEYFQSLAPLGLRQRFNIDFRGDVSAQLLGKQTEFNFASMEALNDIVKSTVGITYRKALATPTYKTIIDQAKSAVESTNVVHMRLHFAANKLLAKYKSSQGLSPKESLTDAQEYEFFTTQIEPLLTHFNYPLAAVDGGNTQGVGITKQGMSRQFIPSHVIESAESAYEEALASAKANNEDYTGGSKESYYPEEYREQLVRDMSGSGNSKSLASQVLKNILKAPAQSAAPSATHSLDSSIQAYIGRQALNMLNVFDAQGGTISSTLAMDGKGNESFRAITSAYNMYADLAEQYTKTDAKFAEVLSPEELATVDTELANALGLPEFEYTGYIGSVKEAYGKISARAKAMNDAITSIDQYPMTAISPYVTKTENTKSLEEILAEHSDSLLDSALPSILGSGTVEESAGVILGAVEEIEGNSEIVRDVVAQGEGLYSTSKSLAGQYFSGALRNFVSVMQMFDNMHKRVTNPEHKAWFQALSKDINELVGANKTLNKLRLPADIDVNNLDAEVLSFLRSSDALSAKSKEALKDPQIQQLLTNSSTEKVASGMYTANPSVNVWLSMDNNLEWLNASPAKLQSPDFLKAVTEANLFDGQLSPSDVIRELLLTQGSGSFIGNEIKGKTNVQIARDTYAYIRGLNSPKFASVWSLASNNPYAKKFRSVESQNTALLRTATLYSDRVPAWFIRGKASLASDPAQLKRYINRAVKRIVGSVDFNYSSDVTPAGTQQMVLDALLTKQEQIDLGYAKEATFTDELAEAVSNIGKEDPKEVYSMETSLETGFDTYRYLGQEFSLQQSSLPIVTASDAALEMEWLSADSVPELSHINEATGNQLDVVKVNETTVRVVPVLGSPTHVNANTESEYHDVSEEPLMETFAKVSEESPIKDSTQHKSRLTALVEAMSHGLSGIKIKLEHVTSGATRGFFSDNTVHISINKLLPKTVTNFMSGSEVMAHELVHAVTRNIGEISPRLRQRAYEMYDIAKQTLTVEDLLDPTLPADDAQVVAQHLYDYMFEDNIEEVTEYTEVTRGKNTRVKSRRVAEFMALVATNENVGRAADKIMAKRPQDKVKGFTGRVIQLLSGLLNMFYNQTGKGLVDGSIREEMVNLVFTISKLQNNHKSTLGRATTMTSEFATAAFNKVDDLTKTFLKDVGEWSINQPIAWNNPRSYVKAITTPLVALARYDEFKDKLRPQLDRLSAFRSQTFLDITTMLSEKSGTVATVHDLIARRTKYIDAARDKTEKQVTEYIEEHLFNNRLSQTNSIALTKAVIETDLNKIVEVFGVDKALDVLHMDNKRLHSLRKQYHAKLKEHKYGQYYINHAKALGELMVQGSSSFYNVHSNAYSIARMAGEKGVTVETDSLADIQEQVDVLASLYAVMNVPVNERMRARNFLVKDAQAAPEGTDKNEGLLGLLQMQKDYAEEALAKNFYDNPQMMRKGYVREIYNPNVELIFSDVDDVESYTKQGFEVVGDIPNSLVKNDENKVMMANRHSAKLNYDQGAFSHTGFTKRGTAIDPKDLLDTNSVGETTDAKILTSEGAKTLKEAALSMYSDAPIRVSGKAPIGISPVRNDDGEIKGYRYTMRSSTKDRVLDRENRVAQVMARTVSSVQDKANSQIHNGVVLDELYKMYEDDFKTKPSEFVRIGSNFNDATISDEYAEMWAMLPSYTRQVIANRNASLGLKPEELYVPKKLLTLMFGAAPLTLDKISSNANIVTKYAGGAIAAILKSKYGRMGGAWYKEALSGSKDTLVIKNVTTTIGNIVSNHYAMSIAGIPQRVILQKSIQGYKELLEYNKYAKELSSLNARLMNAHIGTDVAKAMRSRVQDLEGRISELSVTKIVDEGLYQTIIEEVDTGSDVHNYQTEMGKVGDKLLSMTGRAEGAIRNGVLITHGSTTYRYLRDVAQLSDAVSRYVVAEHMISQGGTVTEAIRKGREMFIHYDAPQAKALKHLNDLGLFNFAKFLLNTQSVLWSSLRESPSRTLMYSLLWAGMGASSTMSVLATPFNFAELLLNRAVLNPLGFVSNGLTELPIIQLFK